MTMSPVYLVLMAAIAALCLWLGRGAGEDRHEDDIPDENHQEPGEDTA